MDRPARPLDNRMRSMLPPYVRQSFKRRPTLAGPTLPVSTKGLGAVDKETREPLARGIELRHSFHGLRTYAASASRAKAHRPSSSQARSCLRRSRREWSPPHLLARLQPGHRGPHSTCTGTISPPQPTARGARSDGRGPTTVRRARAQHDRSCREGRPETKTCRGRVSELTSTGQRSLDQRPASLTQHYAKHSQGTPIDQNLLGEHQAPAGGPVRARLDPHVSVFSDEPVVVGDAPDHRQHDRRLVDDFRERGNAHRRPREL